MKMLKKAQVQKLMEIAGPDRLGALFVEVWHESKPRCYLLVNTPERPILEFGGGKNAGKVSRNIFKWATWKQYDQPYVNMSRYQLVSLDKPAKPQENIGDNSILHLMR